MDTLEMLEEVNGGVEWERILDDIDACVGDYNEAIAQMTR